MSKLSEARQAHEVALADVRNAETQYRALAGRLTQARLAADAARQAGDADAMTTAGGLVESLTLLVRDALVAADARRKVASTAERKVTGILESADGIRRRIEGIETTLAPRGMHDRALWEAETAATAAQARVDRAKRESADAERELLDWRERLAALA